AGLAAAIASTSRQVGASLGVAIGGTIAARSGRSFVAAMHPFFWLVAAGGTCVVGLALVSTSAWGRATLARAATLVAEGDA
ncbi:MAG TPA: hypothetical protein VFQ65_00290, partial [Kofleriaceae bacterium]|nr:hypothetical protein [Kofleriaceae bacterium]